MSSLDNQIKRCYIYELGYYLAMERRKSQYVSKMMELKVTMLSEK